MRPRISQAMVTTGVPQASVLQEDSASDDVARSRLRTSTEEGASLGTLAMQNVWNVRNVRPRRERKAECLKAGSTAKRGTLCAEGA